MVCRVNECLFRGPVDCHVVVPCCASAVGFFATRVLKCSCCFVVGLRSLRCPGAFLAVGGIRPVCVLSYGYLC